MKLLKLLWLSISVLTLSFMVNATQTTMHNDTYRTIKQETSDGIKLINIAPNGEVFNNNDVYEMMSQGRLNEINARYTRNTASIRKQNSKPRLESNKINKENVEAECRKFLIKHSELGIDQSNLKLHNIAGTDKMLITVFVQTFKNYDIKNSFVRMYIYPNGEIQTFSSMYYNDISNINEPHNGNLHLIDNKKVTESATLGLSSNNYKVKYIPVILPIFNGNNYDYKFVLETDIENPGIEIYKAYIDISNFELLKRKNLVFNADVSVTSKHYGNDPNQPLITASMKSLQIQIEGINDTKTTSSAGVMRNLPDDVIGKKFTTSLTGNHASLHKRLWPNESGGSTPYFYEGVINENGIQLHDSNNYDEIMRTIYNSVYDARNYYSIIDPQSPLLGRTMPCYVQIIEEDTAMLNNLFLGFNASAFGDLHLNYLCANHKSVFMGRLNKVTFHEYGHSMVYNKYTQLGQTDGMRSLFANEANADITSAFITDNPRPFDGIVRTGLEDWAVEHNLYRNCDNDYTPDSVHGEAHDDSQLLSGTFWDFKELVEELYGEGNYEDAKYSVHHAKGYLPDGYTVESVCVSWFEALVRANDQRKNPEEEQFSHNFNAIYEAFDKHKIGFDMLINNKFRHTNISDESDVSKSLPISCEIIEFAAPKIIDEVYVNYYTNFNSEIKSVLLTRTESGTGNIYNGEIPAQTDGSRVFYFFTYKDPFSENITKINRNYFCFVGYTNIHSTNCELADDWSANGGTNGWKLAEPGIVYQIEQSPYNQTLYSPGYATSGTRCWTTTTEASRNDQTGKYITTSIKDTSIILSPPFNTDYNNVFLTYQKYLVCLAGIEVSQNGLFVDVSFDGGTTWKKVQSFAGKRKPNNWEWQREYVNLTPYKEAGEDFSNMKIRFVCHSNNALFGLTALIDDIALLGSNNNSGIQDEKFVNTLTITPNPASNEAILNFPNAVVNPEISLANTLGTEVLNIKLQGEYNFSKINISTLPKGVYFTKVMSEGKIYLTKLIIAR